MADSFEEGVDFAITSAPALFTEYKVLLLNLKKSYSLVTVRIVSQCHSGKSLYRHPLSPSCSGCRRQRARALPQIRRAAPGDVRLQTGNDRRADQDLHCWEPAASGRRILCRGSFFLSILDCCWFPLHWRIDEAIILDYAIF